VTAADLRALALRPRQARVKALWAAMGPAARAAAWARLGGDARADVLAACLDAREEP
jgi:hypothetical protein